MSEGCGCRAAAAAQEALRAKATAKAPGKTGGLTVDRMGLRAALGGRAEVIEAMGAKASGRPGVNAGKMWAFLASSLYQSSDLPVVATRECAQNARDAIAAAVRARKLRAGEGRFDVTWDEERRALTWEDNGIGMDEATILTKFLSLGDSGKRDAADSEEAAGGFGIAKAVILATSPGFVWELHTRDNLAISKGMDADVEIFEAPRRAGARITVFGVANDFDHVWDYARQTHVPLLDRLRELLAANDLPDLTLTLNGEVVQPMFSRRGGSKVAVAGSWGQGTTATVKAYRRQPGDRQGAYYVRLGGLFQFKVASQRGNLKADVVVDLVTTVRPGTAGYPLNAARDALQDHARWAFRDLVDEVERENESVGRDQEDDVFDPESEDASERQGAFELGDLAADAFADAAFQKALTEAAGGIADFYAERVKDPGVEAPVDSNAPAGTRVRQGDGPTRGVVLPPGLVTVATEDAPVARLRSLLAAADAERGDGWQAPVLTDDVARALDAAETGTMNGRGITLLYDAVDRAADRAIGAGGGGLLEVGALHAQAEAVLLAAFPTLSQPYEKPTRRNPFGRLAGLRISKKNYDRQRAYRFRKGFHRWMPHLTAWDATLRLVAAEARIRRRFKPGFVLDDELIGLTTSTPSGSNVVYLHPDRFEQVVKAHRERPLAIAAFLHGVAVHELTHLDGRMGRGHDESFVSSREDLGHATGHLLPAIAVLVQRVLGLPVKVSEEVKRIAVLERQLAKARADRAAGRKALGLVERLEADLAAVRRELVEAQAESARVRSECGERCRTCGCDDRAARVVDAAVSALVARPPAGIAGGYVAAFASRNRAVLVEIVRARMPGGTP
jgi:hypothetical protein